MNPFMNVNVVTCRDSQFITDIQIVNGLHTANSLRSASRDLWFWWFSCQVLHWFFFLLPTLEHGTILLWEEGDIESYKKGLHVLGERENILPNFLMLQVICNFLKWEMLQVKKMEDVIFKFRSLWLKRICLYSSLLYVHVNVLCSYHILSMCFSLSNPNTSHNMYTPSSPPPHACTVVYVLAQHTEYFCCWCEAINSDFFPNSFLLSACSTKFCY